MRLILILLSLFAINVEAKEVLIPKAYVHIANKYKIPPLLLYALALHESGKKIKGKFMPHPWTINYKGRGYYFEDRNQMYIFANKLVKKGKLSFDLGVAQVNWRWHGHKFKNLWEATNSVISLDISAQYLQLWFYKTKSWKLAVGKYHAPNNKSHQKRYERLVYKKLAKLKS